MTKSYLLLPILWLPLLAAHSQTTTVHDFANSWASSSLTRTVTLNGWLYFTAKDDTYGLELWKTNGITAQLVKDINPGPTDAVTYFDPLAIGTSFYFQANDGTHGWELWKSDGTEAGTVLVKDLNNGSGSGSPAGFTNNNGVLYFIANQHTLYKSDGTSDGTVGVRSFEIIYEPYAFQGKVYFAAKDYNSNTTIILWRSNGTYTGTVQLYSGLYLPSHFQKVGSKLFFTASSVNEGEELWKTDGTNNGTVVVKDIYPGGNSAVVNFYGEEIGVPYGSYFYFQANDGIHGVELWRTDGTEANTTRLTDVVPGAGSSLQGGYDNIYVVGSSIVFRVIGDAHFWKYTPAGGALAVTTYRNGDGLENNLYLRFKGSTQYSVLLDENYGYELWANDGTPGGEKRVQELVLKNNQTYYQGQNFFRLGGFVGDTLIFTATRILGSLWMRSYALTAPTCYPPEIVSVVKLSPILAHLVWNRQPGAVSYQLRYRITGSPNWIVRTSATSFNHINNLNPTAAYEYQLRTNCPAGWTDWSATATFNLGAPQMYPTAYGVLAERTETPNVERIYWYKGDEVERIQIRYRLPGAPNWIATVTSTNGYKRLINLLPETLYEYQYRPYFAGGGGWGNWQTGHFYTAPDSEYFGPQTEEALSLEIPGNEGDLIFPNPAPQGTGLNFRYSAVSDTDAALSIFDANGRSVLTLEDALTKGENLLSLPTESLAPGIYFLRLKTTAATGTAGGNKTFRFIVQ